MQLLFEYSISCIERLNHLRNFNLCIFSKRLQQQPDNYIPTLKTPKIFLGKRIRMFNVSRMYEIRIDFNCIFYLSLFLHIMYILYIVRKVSFVS